MTALTNDFICVCVCVCVTGSLMYLNEATLLNNVRVRYSKDKIYVSIFICCKCCQRFCMSSALHVIHHTWQDVLSMVERNEQTNEKTNTN